MRIFVNSPSSVRKTALHSTSILFHPGEPKPETNRIEKWETESAYAFWYCPGFLWFLAYVPKWFFATQGDAKWGGISTIAVGCYIAIHARERFPENYPFTAAMLVCYIAAIGLLSSFGITAALRVGW